MIRVASRTQTGSSQPPDENSFRHPQFRRCKSGVSERLALIKALDFDAPPSESRAVRIAKRLKLAKHFFELQPYSGDDERNLRADARPRQHSHVELSAQLRVFTGTGTSRRKRSIFCDYIDGVVYTRVLVRVWVNAHAQECGLSSSENPP